MSETAQDTLVTHILGEAETLEEIYGSKKNILRIRLVQPGLVAVCGDRGPGGGEGQEGPPRSVREGREMKIISEWNLEGGCH